MSIFKFKKPVLPTSYQIFFQNLAANGQSLEHIKQFNYLRNMKTRKINMEAEIQHRMSAAYRRF